MVTTAAKIHGASAIVELFALICSLLFFSLIQFKSNCCVGGVLSFVSFVVAFFVLLAMADKEQFKGTAIAYEGLWQRASLYVAYIPLLYYFISRALK